MLNFLGISRTSIIGYSDGGTIALILVANHPKRVESLVVVAAHIYFEPKILTGLNTIEEASKTPPLKSVPEREHGAKASELVERWLQHWWNADQLELSLLDRLPDIQAPTLMIQGELDEHATQQHAIDIAAGVQDGELWLIPAVYHMPPSEIPVEFNQRVLNFIQPKVAYASDRTEV